MGLFVLRNVQLLASSIFVCLALHSTQFGPKLAQSLMTNYIYRPSGEWNITRTRKSNRMEEQCICIVRISKINKLD